MYVVVRSPDEYTTAVLTAVSRHRGLLVSSKYRDGTRTIRARVPQADVAGFTAKLLDGPLRILAGCAAASRRAGSWRA
jgi:translation elongation factor EF-G